MYILPVLVYYIPRSGGSPLAMVPPAFAYRSSTPSHFSTFVFYYLRYWWYLVMDNGIDIKDFLFK